MPGGRATSLSDWSRPLALLRRAPEQQFPVREDQLSKGGPAFRKLHRIYWGGGVGGLQCLWVTPVTSHHNRV